MAAHPSGTATRDRAAPAAGVGESAARPDAIAKVTGQFAYSSDLWMDDMLWGVTLRSPYPSARIRGIDITAALATPGVHAVLTHEDVPGENVYGLERPDQPVLAADVVRYQGEPVALVAADHPEIARRAADRIMVDYEELAPVTDVVAALAADAVRVHPGGNVVRHLKVRTGDPDVPADVVVTEEYETGMQDQAFLGTESGLAVPDDRGGVDLFIATQWLHVDQAQMCRALGLPPEDVRLVLAGVGGSFGGREDLSIQVHACMLALRTGRPVKMVYSREESFFGHVHRHPARMRYEYGANRDGKLVYAKAEILLDGGAYTSSTPAVVGNAGRMGTGPYIIPNVRLDCYGVFTNNPPCGAMRGFGAVQTAFAYEGQMDRLAAELGLDPVEFRLRNVMKQGDETAIGEILESPAPVAELLWSVSRVPLPPVPEGRADIRDLPGGVSNTTHGEGVARGVGYAVAYKNVGYSEGFDDYATARVRLAVVGGEPTVTVHTAAAEVGQGLVAVQQQVARTELGVDRVVLHPSDTQVGSAGSTSASRQTYMTAGAVQAACERLRTRLLEMASTHCGIPASGLRLERGRARAAVGGWSADIVDVLGDAVLEETVEWRHPPTFPVDPETGQGNAHVQLMFAAHRAVVDVDVELGLVKVVELATAQDVGKAVNPQGLVGQVHGGSAQGLGFAVMEEVQLEHGRVRNPSFTDYLIPTILDMPPMQIEILQRSDPRAPYGLRGMAEGPTLSAGPAIVSAIRAATGRNLTRVPVRPDHIVGL